MFDASLVSCVTVTGEQIHTDVMLDGDEGNYYFNLRALIYFLFTADISSQTEHPLVAR